MSISYREEVLEAMKKIGESTKDFNISESELESILITFSKPTPVDISEMTKELIKKLNNKSE